LAQVLDPKIAAASATFLHFLGANRPRIFQFCGRESASGAIRSPHISSLLLRSCLSRMLHVTCLARYASTALPENITHNVNVYWHKYASYAV